MPYQETKVYFDGSHYIAIPHTTKPYKPRPKRVEEVIEVQSDTLSSEEKVSKIQEETTMNADMGTSEQLEHASEQPMELVVDEETGEVLSTKPKNTRTMTRKQLFETLYEELIHKKRAVRKKEIIERMLPYFPTRKYAERYVEKHFERKKRNLICRRIRLTRKVNLQDFNYFCTFTYDNALHTEESFKKGLQSVLRNFCYRKGWKYVGVWERSPKKKRLHFHGLFYVPEGTMPSELVARTDYSFRTRKRETIHQCLYFLRKFGRNDFEPIDTPHRLNDATAYLMKYLEKSGEKIVYSKGLPQYFISDILDDDVVCTTGIEDTKLVLFDDFLCIDEGEIMGKVSKDTIAKMRKSN